MLRFENVEIDLERYELRLGDRMIRLEKQPMELLALLAERPGQLVTRDEIATRLWPKNTFLDTDQGINSAIRKIRAALKDDAEHPRYILTVVGKGYRFVASPLPTDVDAQSPTGVSIEKHLHSTATLNLRRRGLFFFGAAVLVVLAALLVVHTQQGRPHSLSQPIRSLAVLPLENLSGDPNQEYFSDGMTDEIITNLAQVGSLRVISRTSVMHYKGTRKTLPQIASELKVDAIVEGSIVRTDRRVRVRTQLIDARTDEHLWAESYDSEVKDAINLQREVARAIVTRIETKLTAPEQARFAVHHRVDPKAYDNYLKGRYVWAKFTGEGWKKGIEYFNGAIEIDPSYARAYAGLADCYLRLGAYAEMPPNEAMPKGEAAARKAIEIDDNLGEAHFALAFAKIFYDFDWSGADRELQRGLILDPGNAIGRMTYSIYLSALGRTQDAIEEQKRALELDPLSLIINSNLARAYYFARENDKAIEQSRKTLSLEPTFERARNWLIVAYWAKGMYRQSVEEEQEALRRAGKGELAEELGRVYAASGYRGVLQWEMETNLRAWRKGEEQASSVAMAYSDLGRKDEAFQWLEKARKAHEAPVVLVKVMRSYDSLRNDARYVQFLHDLGLPD